MIDKKRLMQILVIAMCVGLVAGYISIYYDDNRLTEKQKEDQRMQEIMNQYTPDQLLEEIKNDNIEFEDLPDQIQMLLDLHVNGTKFTNGGLSVPVIP